MSKLQPLSRQGILIKAQKPPKSFTRIFFDVVLGLLLAIGFAALVAACFLRVGY